MSDEYDLRAGNIESALEQFDGLEMVMEEDKENLDDLIDRLSEMDFAFRSGLSKGKSDTEKVLEAYRETFHKMEGRTDIQNLDSEVPLSTPASEFLGELTNIASINYEQASHKAKFLDGKNNLTRSHYNELVIYFESFKQVREELSKDLDGERNALRHYSNELDNLSEDLINLSEENPFDELKLADAGNILEDLEDYQDRIKQLRKRRIHEIKRRSDIYDGLAENNFLKAYKKATDSKTPVVDELDYFEDKLEEAYETVVSAF